MGFRAVWVCSNLISLPSVPSATFLSRDCSLYPSLKQVSTVPHSRRWYGTPSQGATRCPSPSQAHFLVVGTERSTIGPQAVPAGSQTGFLLLECGAHARLWRGPGADKDR